MALATFRDDHEVLWVQFAPVGHRPPLLTTADLGRLESVVDQVQRDPPAGLIFSGQPGGDFLAGIDLDELAAIPDRAAALAASRRGQHLFQRIADLPCPTVAAIEGRCLGAGLELALACRVRLASDEEATVLALPEVHLGILPGFGGTQRLPRLIGQRRSLDMILTGRAVRAASALAWGLVDRVVTAGRLRTAAVEVVAGLNQGRFRVRGPRLALRPWELLAEGVGPVRRMLRRRYLKAVRARTGGHYPAPEMIVAAVGWGADGMPLQQGLRAESEYLAELVAGPVHRHLLGLLRARQALRRPRGKSVPLPENIPARLAELMVQNLSPGSSPTAPSYPPGARRDTVRDRDRDFLLLRRLPAARRPGAIEIVIEPGRPGSEPGIEDLQETARTLVTRTELMPVWCTRSDSSPGLEWVAAYLREGNRLAAEGVPATTLDQVWRAWGMAAGPFELARRLDRGWEKRIARTAAFSGSDRPAGPAPPVRRASLLEPQRLIEEMVAILALEAARLQPLLAPPAAAGWAVLDCFVLGGPPFRGGILGAARTMGLDLLEHRLRALAEGWGSRYDPRPLLEHGLPAP